MGDGFFFGILQGVLKGGSWFEAHSLASLDFNFFTCLRIATFSRFPVSYSECSKSGIGEPFVFLNGFTHALERRVQNVTRQPFGQIAVLATFDY